MNNETTAKSENLKPAETAIRVENLSKTFRIPHEKISTLRGAFVNLFRTNGFEEFKALDNVSFEVKKGEFFGIIGRNGSGKSTLLKILAGIYQPDKVKVHPVKSGSAGSKQFNGVKVNGLISPFLELGIGFNPELSGRDNIFLNATVLGLTHKQIEEKFDDIVNFSELRRFIDQKVKNYSSGMMVRLAFSVAIHANRDILLMDEVLAVGDTNFQNKCLDIFRKLKKEGRTIIFVSHDLESVREFCDRVALLNLGEIITVSGPEKAIYEYSRVMVDVDQKSQKTEIEMTLHEKEEAKKKAKKVKKDGNRIVEVKLFNSRNEERGVFEGGEDIIVRLKYEIKKVEEDMYVSVGIFDKKTNELVCGNNMFFEKVKKEWKEGLNEIELTFKKNYFNRGNFFITSFFFKGDPRDNYQYDYFDSRESKQFFKVLPKYKHQGLTYLPHEWKF